MDRRADAVPTQVSSLRKEALMTAPEPDEGCPFDPPCWFCANPDRWAVEDGEIVRLDEEEDR